MARLPTQLAPEILFLMGKIKSSLPAASLGKDKGKGVAKPPGNDVPNVYLNWQSTLSGKDVKRLRDTYAIPEGVVIQIPNLNEGAVPSAYNREVAVYEVMFRAGLCFPLPPLIRELLMELNLAPSQVKPNGWRLHVSFCVLWLMVFGVG